MSRARILARPITLVVLKCAVLPIATQCVNEVSFYATDNNITREEIKRCAKSKMTSRSQMQKGADDVDRVIIEAASLYCYANLKAEQKRVLKSFVEGIDVFVSLPTGNGKSLCYTLLPAIFNMKNGLTEKTSICLIVSLLIALMKDQSVLFAQKGITATFVSDKETTDKETRRRIRRGECQLMFISPEALFLTAEWRGMLSSDLYRHYLVGFMVDEAHCVK